jgi:hypothetical protein
MIALQLETYSNGWSYLNGLPIFDSRTTSLILILVSMAYIAFQMYKVMYPNRNITHKYEGEKNSRGQAHGEGKLIASNGAVYTGEFSNGRFHGQGHYKFPDSKASYSGPFIDGAFHGPRGVEKYEDGSVYTGAFVDGLREGRGTMKYADGSYYSGEWKEGKKQGQGKFKYSNGDLYIGSFVGGRREGEGKIKDKRGKIRVGTFKDGVLVGEMVEVAKGSAAEERAEEAALEAEMPEENDQSVQAKALRARIKEAKEAAEESRNS